jgi:ABC-type nitrate/sulfonate/bicarbonate transport system ATPase subunit
MSNRTFEGKVSVVLNSKGEIALKRDPEGAWDATQATALHQKMTELGKKNKASINKYSLFVTEGGTEAVLLANRYGNPYIAVLPKRDGNQPNRPKVTKLA